MTWSQPLVGASLRRVDWACRLADQATSITTAAEKVRDAIFASPGPSNNNNADAWLFLDSGLSGDCITLARTAAAGLSVLGIPAAPHQAWPSHDTVNTGNPSDTVYPANISSETCKSPITTSKLVYLGFTWNAVAMYPLHNNFEGFFCVEDPIGHVKAYTVFPPGGGFDDQDYYYLQVLRSVTSECYWASDGLQTQGGITFQDHQEIPGLRWPLAYEP